MTGVVPNLDPTGRALRKSEQQELIDYCWDNRAEFMLGAEYLALALLPFLFWNLLKEGERTRRLLLILLEGDAGQAGNDGLHRDADVSLRPGVDGLGLGQMWCDIQQIGRSSVKSTWPQEPHHLLFADVDMVE
jgi:hypothetical protein